MFHSFYVPFIKMYVPRLSQRSGMLNCSLSRIVMLVNTLITSDRAHCVLSRNAVKASN
jgi:hypothetical protein